MSTPEIGSNTHQTTISLEAFGAAEGTPDDAEPSSLRVLTVGRDDAYIGIITKEGFPVTAHFLDDSEGWPRGYVHCLGDECPACQAGMKPNSFIYLPVLELSTAQVALLRVSSLRGPGKLITELERVMDHPHIENLVLKVSREGSYVYSVHVVSEKEHDPDAIRAVQQFRSMLEAGSIEPTASVTKMPSKEMANHPRIQRILQLQGLN